VVVLLRRDGGAWAVTATNNSSAPRTVHVQLPAGAPGEFRDALSDARVRPGADGSLSFEVPPMSGVALVYDAVTALR
jgi:hypothetical protein